MERIVIPNSVTKINKLAFADCTALKEVVMSNAITEIGQAAFHICSNLTAISLPNSLMKIGIDAFVNTSLKTVKIPSSVKDINSSAFRVKGIEVFCYASEPPGFGNIFGSGQIKEGFTLHIPKGSKEKYLNSQYWKTCEAVMIDDL